MPHFVKRVSAENHFFNFYFNRIYTETSTHFHVSVWDNRTKRSYMFEMKEMNGHWILSADADCPNWIKDLEKELEQSIRDHLAS